VAFGLCKSDRQFIPCTTVIKFANDILEEGEDDVKFAWLSWARLHMCYMTIIIGNKALKQKESKKMALVWIVLCNSKT